MTIGRKILLGFLVSAIVPLLLAAVAYRSMTGLIDTNYWVAHTHEVIGELEGVLSLCKDLELGTRGYVMTGRDEYLEPEQIAERSLEGRIAKLKAMTADNPAQQRRIERLTASVGERRSRARAIIELRRSKGEAAASGEIAPIKQSMDAIRTVVAEMTDEEMQLLRVRIEAARVEGDWTRLVLLLGAALSALLMVIAGWVIARAVTTPVREVVSQLRATSSELLAGTTEQAAGAQQQASAVAETVTTVDEVTKTAEHAAQGARSLGESIQKSLDMGRINAEAVERSAVATANLKTQIETTAESILSLATQAQAIGEIIASVNDIAEQTNLLALNAAIEASRAGEHGRGFAVVATEVKSLADLSKKSTAQVRQLLGEIQRGTNVAVISIEDVTKGVNTAARVTEQSGQTIRGLGDTLDAAAQVSAQIVASAGQQAMGMAQIHQAMRSLDQVAKQNMAATRQAEQAARGLNDLGGHLTSVVGK